MLLGERTLKIADGVPFQDVLLRELGAFRVKVNRATGHDSYEAWRERDHDDLVLAVAFASWLVCPVAQAARASHRCTCLWDA
jgi:hypothetical protein